MEPTDKQYKEFGQLAAGIMDGYYMKYPRNPEAVIYALEIAGKMSGVEFKGATPLEVEFTEE